MANIKKVQSANSKITEKLKAIEDGEKEREALRRQRDDLNEQITRITQQLGAAKTDLDLAVDELRKGMAE